MISIRNLSVMKRLSRKVQAVLGKGFMSIYSDIPYLLRGRRRLGEDRRKILETRRKRFSLRMSGMHLVTLGNIAYSYFQDTRLGPYAYAFSFANRLIGYIKIPGMMELQPKEGMPLLKCPYKCKGDFEGRSHACSCRSNHLQQSNRSCLPRASCQGHDRGRHCSSSYE